MNNCNSNGNLTGCGEAPARSNCPPSPEPPWSRARQSTQNQILGQAGNVSLTVDVTYLDATVGAPPAPIAITIPDGNYKGQFKRIMIQGDKLATTETFNLAGTFAGFNSLTFNGVGSTALLEWDGTAWRWLGGDVVTNA